MVDHCRSVPTSIVNHQHDTDHLTIDTVPTTSAVATSATTPHHLRRADHYFLSTALTTWPTVEHASMMAATPLHITAMYRDAVEQPRFVA